MELSSENDLDLVHRGFSVSESAERAHEILSLMNKRHDSMDETNYSMLDVEQMSATHDLTTCEVMITDEQHGHFDDPLLTPCQSIGDSFSSHSYHNINTHFSVLLQACGDVQAIQLILDDYKPPSISRDVPQALNCSPLSKASRISSKSLGSRFGTFQSSTSRAV
jgi:hypothetical protein